MSLTNIFEMGKGYLMLGGGLVLITALCFSIGYGLIYRKMCKGRARLSTGRLFLSAVCICYLAVLFGATVLRPGTEMRAACIYPFYSYREAWHSFSSVEWRNLILNILLFVPLGFLLPFWASRFRKFYWTVGAGLLTTLAIELIQLATGRGVFEADDLINNTLGTAIGYGLFAFCSGIRSRFRRKTAWFGLLPAAFTLAAYMTGYLIYENQAYGNLICEPNYTVNMKDAEVSAACDLEQEEKTGTLYRSAVAERQEMDRRAQDMFAALGTDIGEERTVEYDDVTVYYSKDERYCLWLYKNGLTYSFTDYSVFDDTFDGEKKENATEEEIKEALSKYGIEAPEEAAFEENGEGRYTFLASMCEKDDGAVLDGSIQLTYNTNGVVSELNYRMVELESCGEEALISQREAYERIKAGKFEYLYFADKIQTLLVKAVSLGYEMDSKGFYQPVHCFICERNGEDLELRIPALAQ